MGATEQAGHRCLAEEPVLEAGQIRPQGRGAEEQVSGLAEVRQHCLTQPGGTASLAPADGLATPRLESWWDWACLAPMVVESTITEGPER